MKLPPLPRFTGTTHSEAIYQSIKREIAEGRWEAGERLPSIRKMAALLAVSPTPVESAYQQLVAEGYIESKPRSGYFAASLPEAYERLFLRHTPEKKNEVPAGPGYYDAWEDGTEIRYDFHLSKNDFEPFPMRMWKRTLHRVLSEEGTRLLFYGHPQGEPGLRQQIASYLQAFRGVRCTPDQIVVGAEQHLLMNLLARILWRPGCALAFEDPGYRLIPATFEQAGFELRPIALDRQGISVAELRDSGAAVAAVGPSHQFPRGIVMPIQRRLELLQWAVETEATLIEDDYGGEFRYDGKPIPSLQGLLPGDRVVYLGGFSQVLAPDLCIHYMVLPERLLPRFRELRRHLMFEPSSPRVFQRTLELFLKEGHFEKHVRKLRNVYRHKNKRLETAVRDVFGPAAALSGGDAGMHMILTVRSDNAESLLLRLAQASGVFLSSARFDWSKRPEGPEKSFLLGFGGIPLSRIDEGVRALGDAWRGRLEPLS
ncbi:PLP-dependent aminotransferase family protein [Paenibacillus sp. TRM 82003]|nr:PLP-dependent aminotransferase family protein [Paenibacillus sp. TRM 82003]